MAGADPRKRLFESAARRRRAGRTAMTSPTGRVPHRPHHAHGHMAAPLSRRLFLRRSSEVTLAAAISITAAGALLNSVEAWGLEVEALKPQTMKTLILVARDIYPHDKVAD